MRHLNVRRGERPAREHARIWHRHTTHASVRNPQTMIRFKNDFDKFVVQANFKRRGWEEVTCVLDEDW